MKVRYCKNNHRMEYRYEYREGWHYRCLVCGDKWSDTIRKKCHYSQIQIEACQKYPLTELENE